jgi:Cytochrome C oxidase, cbb3-type, subunit III
MRSSLECPGSGHVAVRSRLGKSTAVALSLVLGAVNSGASEPERPHVDRNAYVAYGCYQCHGYEGQGGGIYGGPRIAPRVWPFAAFASQLRRPRGSPIPMPAYSPAILNEADLKRIYDYLLSIREPVVPQN